MTTTRSITRSPLLWVAGLIVIAFVVAVLASGGGDDETSTATETASVSITGDGLPGFTSTADDPAVGTAAPGFSGVSFDDSAVDATDPAPRVVGFFAHWCPHCQRELPIVEEWLDEGLLPDGVEFVAVSTAVESQADNYPPSAWFADVGYDATVVVDDADSSLADAFGLPGFPFWVVTDADGQVVGRVGGAVDRTGFESLGQLALG